MGLYNYKSWAKSSQTSSKQTIFDPTLPPRICPFVSILHQGALPAERGADFSTRFCSKAAAAARSAARFRLIRRAALVLSRGRSNRSSAVVAVSVSCREI